MAKRIFISHAGADSAAALDIAERLITEGVHVDIDREELRSGDSFLSFMEGALSSSDYCLLLWSKAASEGKYVQMEWEAALYKTIEESRRFLLVARLHDYPVPALLGPRLRVDFFPDSGPGLAQLLELLREDATAEIESGRRLGQGAVKPPEEAAGAEIYLTSEIFGLTLPLRWDLDMPCGVHLDGLTQSLGLPKQHDHEGVMGVRYSYGLARDDQTLSRTKSLAEQGVEERAVVWLEVEMKPFATGAAVGGELTTARFRGDHDPMDGGRKALLDAVSRAGLGF